MKNKLFMIQGVFFFAHIGEPLMYYHFSGMIHPNEQGDGLAGVLLDTFGDSKLSEIEIGENEITFVKIYDGREDIISYHLRKSPTSNIWHGFYSGESTGVDKVNCLITEVPIEFLNPDLNLKEGKCA